MSQITVGLWGPVRVERLERRERSPWWWLLPVLGAWAVGAVGLVGRTE